MARRSGWLFVMALLSCPPRVHSGKRDSLFEFIEQVKEISPKTFSGIAASSEPWVLDCYSPACPHCKRFAPTWEKVGTALRDGSVRVGAINCLKHHSLCNTLEVRAYPSLVAINSPGGPQGTADKPSFRTLKKGSNSFDHVMDAIKDEFPGVQDLVAFAEDGVGAPKDFQHGALQSDGPAGSAPGAPCVLRIEDATVSVRFALRNDVFVSGNTLSEGRMGALLSFLDLLATTFPGKANRDSFRSLAAELRSNPELNDFARWDKRIGNLHIGSFGPETEGNWPAGSLEHGSSAQEGVNHYTFGLWCLLHALSVSSAPTRQHPYAVMEGIHSFVSNFFRCEHCRTHFLEMYSGCDNGRCKIQKPSNVRSQRTSEAEPALALWVWRMHNAVNVRLAHEGDEDIDPQKSLWPSATLCKECWSGYPLGEGEPSWSETEVLKLLRRTFSCPEGVGEGQDAPGSSWAVICMLVCAAIAVLLWGSKWVEMRGIGLTKRQVDTTPLL